MKPVVSICIPAYNRPEELMRLLRSIDIAEDRAQLLEIVIREDCSPAREQIRQRVEEFASDSKLSIRYIENETNYGYDKNLRSVAKEATGDWVLFMGDDDLFVPGALSQYLDFIQSNIEIGYILRRYRVIHKDGSAEDHRYARQHAFFPPGEQSIIALFRRSLYISGFSFRREWFTDYDCSDYDGTLLFQLYILAVVCKEHPSAYCDHMLTERREGATPYFGVSEAEKDLYESGTNTVENSINFMRQVRVLTESIDRKLGTKVSEAIIKEYSKYSYGFLYEHRDDGLPVFREYAKELKKLGFACTPYFYLYYIALYVLGKDRCQTAIRRTKSLLGVTPRL